MSIREIRNQARSGLHAAFAVPAVYYSPDRETVIACSVRVHERSMPMGDMTGFDFDPSQRFESVPEIVFLAAEVRPERLGVVVVAPDETYLIQQPMPRDGLTVKAQVSRRSASAEAKEPLAGPGAE